MIHAIGASSQRTKQPFLFNLRLSLRTTFLNSRNGILVILRKITAARLSVITFGDVASPNLRIHENGTATSAECNEGGANGSFNI